MAGDSPAAAFPVRVECGDGPAGMPVPTRFHLAGRAIDVADVVDTWPGEDRSYVKVVDPEGRTYILRHDAASGAWEVTLYRRRGP